MSFYLFIQISLNNQMKMTYFSWGLVSSSLLFLSKFRSWYIYIYIYIFNKDESKVLGYFGKVWHNFAEVKKMSNHPGLWDAELAWYSPCTTRRLWLNSFEHSLRIHDFLPIQSYLIVEFLATQVRIQSLH